MELSDIELIEDLPNGIIIDSVVKDLDKFSCSFALSGIDFETCVTLSCAKEVVRLSPIKVVITSRQFVEGTIGDIVELARTSEKYFKILLWCEPSERYSDESLKKVGIDGTIYKREPFEKMLKKVKNLMNLK